MVRNSHVLELCHSLLEGGRPVVGTQTIKATRARFPWPTRKVILIRLLIFKIKPTPKR